MNNRYKTRMLGLTIIELLLVVGLIAVLAALAVPNLLNAQVRSKIARTQADLRTLSVGADLYRVDNSSFPDSAPAPQFKAGMSYSSACLRGITTPIAYLTKSDYKDTFSQQYPLVFVNLRAQLDQLPSIIDVLVPGLSAGQKADIRQHEYTLAGVGPDGLFHSQVVGDAAVIRGLTSRTDSSSEYDPTNGTSSPGDITRTAVGSW